MSDVQLAHSPNDPARSGPAAGVAEAPARVVPG